jgi:hypothetical protein
MLYIYLGRTQQQTRGSSNEKREKEKQSQRDESEVDAVSGEI